MSRPTTTNFALKKALPSDPERTSGLAEHWGPVMDANLDAIDTALASAVNGVIGGTDTQVQFNDGGLYGGDGGLTYDKTSHVLTVTGGIVADVTGDLTGNVIGDVTGDVTGNVTGDVTGDLVGNVTMPDTLTPSSAATAGVTGQIAWDAAFIYVCTAGGTAGNATWMKAALSAAA